MNVRSIGLAVAAIAAIAVGTLAPAGSAMAATAGPAVAGASGTLACEVRDVYVPGGEAHWTKCTGTYTAVNGWVKDTRADGKCAEVYAIWSSGAQHTSSRACPSGTTRSFAWTEYGTASVYLRTVG